MKNYLIKIFTSPVTHFNVLIIGVLICIGVLHNHAHYAMEYDIHGVVRKYCKANPGYCSD